MNDKDFDTLVLSSGGTKGIAFIGALDYISQFHSRFNLCNIETFVGTSIGGMISLLLSICYSVQDLKDVALDIHFHSFFTDVKIINFVSKMGVVNPSSIRKKIQELISLKGFNENINLGTLYSITKKNLVFISTDIISEKIVYISHSSHPSMKVIDAVMSSMSIPFVFPPVKFENMCLVDGALLEPVCCNKDVIGKNNIILDVKSIMLDSVNSIGDYILKLVNTSVNNNRKHIPEENYFRIQTTESNILDTSLDSPKILKLFQEGFDSIKLSLKLKEE